MLWREAAASACGFAAQCNTHGSRAATAAAPTCAPLLHTFSLRCVAALRCIAVPPPYQVEMWVKARRRVPDVLPGLHIEEGERVLVEISRKFTPRGGALPAVSANVLVV